MRLRMQVDRYKRDAGEALEQENFIHAHFYSHMFDTYKKTNLTQYVIKIRKFIFVLNPHKWVLNLENSSTEPREQFDRFGRIFYF